MQKIPIYIADLTTDSDMMLSLSFTERPATGYKCKVLERTSEGVRIFAPILPANTPIYRNNSTYGEHYVMFLPDVVTDIMQDSMARNIPFDFEHKGVELEGVQWVESFQIDHDKGKGYTNYTSDLPDGTWGGVFFIPNIVFPISEPKNRSLDFLGISISGIFSYDRLSLADAIEIYNKIKI